MATTRLECFKATINANFSFLKTAKTVDELWAKAIPVEKGEKGFWLPVGQFHFDNPEFDSEVLGFFEKSKTVQNGFTSNSFKEQVPRYGSSQVALFYVDRFGNKQALLSLSEGDVERFEICISNLTTSGLLNQSDFSVALRELALWLNSAFVADKVSIDTNDFDLIGGAGFVKSDKGCFFKSGTHDLGKKEILTAGPSISSQEASYVLDAVRYGWNSEWAKYIKKFETTFADYIGVKHALTTSSCTGALHIALKALEIGPGDEVIVPDITWVATASAIEYVGATPVFADIDPENWCLDPKKLESYITPKTKCIMPVHLYGHPAEMDKIMEIANKHKLYVVEDAAPAIGAECRGKKAGSFGHFAAFSFQGAKLLVTGEGGMLVTSDPELYKKAYAIWDHGRTPGTFWINQVGLKYKMANILAALGLAQIERAEEQIHAKRRIFQWYKEELESFSGVNLCVESSWARSIYWMSSLVIDSNVGISRDDFFKKLKEYKIDTRPVFPAISSYPMWKPSSNPIAKNVGDWGVNLPSGVGLTEEQVRYVAQSIKKIISSVK